jgi:hypothetical protein
LETPLSINAGTHPTLTVIALYRASDLDDNQQSGGLWGEDNGGFDRFTADISLGGCLNAVSTGSACSAGISNLYLEDEWVLSAVIFDEDVPDGSFVHVNGKLERTFSSDHAPGNSNTFHIGHIGRLAGHPYEGDIAEVIVYSSLLDNSSQGERIESYLALKYGITLDSSANYIDSSDNILWNATTNSTYHHDVAGIGIDARSALTQTTSRSVNDDSIVTITGTLASMESGEFLVWGNDDGATSASSEVPAAYTQRLTREWKVAETGEVGNVTVSFDLTGISEPDLSNAADFALLTDADGDFSDATAITGAIVSGNQVTFTGVDFSDGQFFSLAYPEPLPALGEDSSANLTAIYQPIYRFSEAGDFRRLCLLGRHILLQRIRPNDCRAIPPTEFLLHSR